MDIISGIFFALAMVLAVMLGGQTIDYTWGPALLALALSLVCSIPRAASRAAWTRSTQVAVCMLLLAGGWILFRCAGSPVREFARSDALLVAGMLSSFFWALWMPPGGGGLRVLMVGLALLVLANTGIAVHQLSHPDFAWPFASRADDLPSGLFGHYNHFADFSLVAAVVLAARFARAGDHGCERLLQLLGALAGVGGVILSGSRGGLLSLGVALMVFLVLWTVLAWRDKTKHSKVLTVLCMTVPLLLALLAGPLLEQVEQRRGMHQSTGTVAGTADNVFRLTFVGVAFDVAAKHGWKGGGSRSFGWGKYACWDPELHGSWDRFDDDLVHNEFAQLATDYGWTGVLLVSAAVVAVGLAGVAGMISRGGESCAAVDAAAIGGLAAMAGTLVHSNFSFVTHTLPGAMYLGLAMGLILPRLSGAGCNGGLGDRQTWFKRGVLFALFAGMGVMGIQASRVYRELWHVWFAPPLLVSAPLPDEALAKIEQANRWWPSADLSGAAAGLSRAAADDKASSAAERERWLARTAHYYAGAAKLNSLDPEWALNGGNVLSSIGRDEEAERWFLQAIELEGGMESLFRARYYYGRHLYQRWYRLWTQERRAEEALYQFLQARDVLREAQKVTPEGYWGEEGRALQKELEDAIRFLEGAQVVPREPER
ncbi:MAG: O-antigen ligase domain-containing protein [Verrucomicrobia bacterium]|nr:MAG: O-antigen ligase domain-containing protein [Verrucomicrobiota bacterium]TAE86050.1 MAG: O-antigen ligase domain-containing protein [Verrucomicrobiota bacterium]TAF25839.1 MAG: O-antigen ligase domain-containing protein [Verrucomicrobiota bacterium]